MLRGTNVVVRDGRIDAIGTSAKAPDGAVTVDGSGKTLLPGFIDSHTHIFGIDSLREAAMFGVTTELDMFSVISATTALKKDLAAGKYPDAARFETAGTLVTSPKGHGTEYGIPIPTITKPEDAQAFVDARIAEGSDYIKIIYDDGHTYGMNTPTISKETMAAVIASAHQRHKLAVVHIGSYQGARDAIEAGADGLMHLFVDEKPAPDFGKFVAAHHAFVVPTLAVNASVSHLFPGKVLLEDKLLSPLIPVQDANTLKTGFPVHNNAHLDFAATTETIRQLKAAKVPILAGTDAPNPGTAHGASMHEEMKMLVDAGLTPTEALAAATSIPAEWFSMPDRGRVAKGLRADLLLVRGDPTKDILKTRDIAGVWVGGLTVDRDAWRARVEKEQAVEANLKNAPAPPGSESGAISNFEDGKASAKFGSAWTESTDSIAGGKSTVQLAVADDGANGSTHSLRVSGEVVAAFAAPWAGAMFMPGAQPMQPANLSKFKKITFWARGDGKRARLMMMAKSFGFVPEYQFFAPGPEWKQFSFALTEFKGTMGYDVMAFIFSGGPDVGPFSFQIDEVKLE